MYSIFLASTLFSLTTNSIQPSHKVTLPTKISIDCEKISLHYPSKNAMTSFINHIQFCLDQDLKGNSFEPLVDQDLLEGDILVFGNHSQDIEIVGVCQNTTQFLYVTAKHTSAELSIADRNDPKWKKNYTYQGYFRPSQETANTTAHTYAQPSTPMFWNGLLMSHFVNKEKLPFVLIPKNPTTFTLPQLLAWNETRQWQMQSVINEHGAILLRNCCIRCPEDFAAIFASTVARTPMDYIGEGSRKKIVPGVYTSTEGPPEFHIHLHHELSCTHYPASYISFYCEVAPISGTGQTILGRTEEITKALHKNPKVWNFFKGKNIKYVSRHPGEENFFTKVNKTHKTWPEVFETSDRKQVERICHEKGLEYTWDGDWIVLSRIVPAIRGPDKYFPFEYWYNQLHLYHSNARSRSGFLNYFLESLLYMDPSTRQYEVTLEDGTSIPDDIVYAIYDVLEACTIKFDWQKGDVLVIDNRKVLHGRAPTSGERRILASMAP